MVILFLAFAGLVPTWIGYTLFLVPGNEAFAFANSVRLGNATLGLPPDTAAATNIRASASGQVGTGTLWMVSGLVIWLLTVPMLWWWLSARRRLA